MATAPTPIPDWRLPDPEGGGVPEGYVPEGFETVDDFLKDMRETYTADLEADHDNRFEAQEDREFAAGQHWDPVVLESRKGLPCLTINDTPQFIGQVVGDWRVNRVGVKVLPKEDGDINIAAIRSDLIRNIEVQSRADRVYNNAFESMATCGDGAFRVALEYSSGDVFDQDIFLRPIDDALSVVWDRMSIDPTGRDALHCFVDDRLPRKDFDRRWPDHDPSELSNEQRSLMSTGDWCDTDTVRVTEYWRIIERDRLLALFQDGAVIDVTDIEPEKGAELMQRHGPVIRSRMAPCKYAQMHVVTGYAILDGPYEYKIDRLPIIRVSGRVINVGVRRKRFGLVRDIKDAIRLRDFYRSLSAEALGYATKAVWIAPEDAVEGREEAFRQSHMNRDPLLVYNSDASAVPQRIQPTAPQSAILQEAQINAQDIKDITGIHEASLGIRSNETSGKAIMARQREGDIASVTYYDNGNAAVLEAGDVINQLIPQIYDAARSIRIVGEDEEPRLLRINDESDPDAVDISQGRYDVTMTTGASYTTRRVEAADAMMQAVQANPALMQIAGDLIAKAQDWPGADELADRLRKTIPPELLAEDDEPAIPPALKAQMDEMMGAIQTLQAENDNLKTSKDLETRKVDADAYGAETSRLKVLVDALNNPASAAVMGPLILKEMQDIGMSPDILPIEQPVQQPPIMGEPDMMMDPAQFAPEQEFAPQGV
jgi:hypothetical protein